MRCKRESCASLLGTQRDSQQNEIHEYSTPIAPVTGLEKSCCLNFSFKCNVLGYSSRRKPFVWNTRCKQTGKKEGNVTLLCSSSAEGVRLCLHGRSKENWCAFYSNAHRCSFRVLFVCILRFAGTSNVHPEVGPFPWAVWAMNPLPWVVQSTSQIYHQQMRNLRKQTLILSDGNDRNNKDSPCTTSPLTLCVLLVLKQSVST